MSTASVQYGELKNYLWNLVIEKLCMPEQKKFLSGNKTNTFYNFEFKTITHKYKNFSEALLINLSSAIGPFSLMATSHWMQEAAFWRHF